MLKKTLVSLALALSFQVVSHANALDTHSYYTIHQDLPLKIRTLSSSKSHSISLPKKGQCVTSFIKAIHTYCIENEMILPNTLPSDLKFILEGKLLKLTPGESFSSNLIQKIQKSKNIYVIVNKY